MIKKLTLLLATACSFNFVGAQAQPLSTTPIIGDVILGAFNFCPVHYLPADGMLLSTSAYRQAFSAIGTTYGGDGRTTFALPDLRGRIPVHSGTGQGFSPVVLGSKFGRTSVTLDASDLPVHSHSVAIKKDGPSDQVSPQGHSLTDITVTGGVAYAAITGANRTEFSPRSIGQTGASQPISVMSPSVGMTYCVAVTGTFPQRNP